MTRKEQILQAARDYVSGVTLSSPSDVIHFEYGARWTDEHPVNVWHDTNEEPNYNELMLGIDSNGVSLYKWCGQEDSWKTFVDITELIRWTYVSDLLPKCFRNYKQEKNMNENLNLVEILKNCPEGTKLYSTTYGDVEFIRVNQNDDVYYPIEIKLSDDSINSVTTDGRLCEYYNGECVLFPSKEQRDWSKFKVKSNKPKFDPKTLQPFDKVLARDMVNGQWRCTFYSHERKDIYKYVTTDYTYKYCIPYNDDTQHLVGTTDEAPEFYRYWEDI